MPSNSPLTPLCKELALRFPKHLSGSSEGLFVVVSEHPLTARTYQALSASAIASGFGRFPFDPFLAPKVNGAPEPSKEDRSPLTLITLKGETPSPNEQQTRPKDSYASIPPVEDIAQGQPNGSTNAEQPTQDEGVSRETLLSPADLILAIETLDPLVVVSVDMVSAKALADAYQTQIKLNTPQTLLGRSLRCFENFDSMISTNEGKQNAWKLLKNMSVDRP